MTLKEVIFARKIKLVHDKFLPNQSKTGHTNKVTWKRFEIDGKVFFRVFQSKKPDQYDDKLKI